ncbi:MAG: hypothetical protein K0U47_00180 [Epsilonproteobacteria bacterium]|nr:hypothetical protein [Campylobacterota bacterium]
MQQILLSLFILLFSFGCGGGSNNKTIVNFSKNSNTSYDLTKYLYSTPEQTLEYAEKSYLDKNGLKNYSQIPSESFTTSTYTETEGTQVREYVNGILDNTYMVTHDRLITTSDTNTIIEYARYVNLGDTFVVSTQRIESYALVGDLNMQCKITEYLTSKEVENRTYDDLLKIECTGTFNSLQGATLQGIPYSYTTKPTEIAYIAKNIGLIQSTTESCSTLKVNNKTITECSKETIDLIELTTP